MKRITLLLLSFIILFIPAEGTGAAVPNGDELTYKEALWAKMNEGGRMTAVPDGVFRRGEVVNLILRKVGTFQQGADGKHFFDIDMVVKGPSGAVVLSKKGLLGNEGHRLLENGIASSPYGIFESHVGLEPGKYQMTLTIQDKISGADVVAVKAFTLSGGLSYRKAVFAKKGNDGKLTPVDDSTFARGEVVNLIFLNVGKFKKGPDGKHLFDIDLEVKNPKGERIFQQEKMLGENGHTLLENDIADSPYGIFYTSIELEPGIYRMTLTIYDKIGNERVSVTKPFKLK
ncbi:MAG: hypothetical protein GY950_14565 [bacterium]|nr:hypothetical protein [bacterium]